MRTLPSMAAVVCFALAPHPARAEPPAVPSSTAPSSAAPSSTEPSSTEPSSTAPSSTEPSSTAPAPAAPSPYAPAAAPGEPPRLLLHANVGMNLYTFLGPKDGVDAVHLTPLQKLSFAQQLGIGYAVHPNVRLQLALLFGESVTGVPPGDSPFSYGVVPWVAYASHGFFMGAGPLLAFSPAGLGASHVNLFTVVGYALPLGGGFSFLTAAQGPVAFHPRFSVGVTTAVGLARWF